MNQTGETYFPKSKCPSHGLNLLLLGHGNCMLLSSRAWSEGELLKHFRSFVCFSFFSQCQTLDMFFRLRCNLLLSFVWFSHSSLKHEMKLRTFIHWKTTMNQKKNLGIKGFVYKRYSFGSKFLRVWPSLPFPFCVPKFRCHDWIVKKNNSARSSWPATHLWKPKRPRQLLLLGPFEASSFAFFDRIVLNVLSINYSVFSGSLSFC